MEGSTSQDHVIGIPVSSRAYGIEEPDFPAEEATPDRASFVGPFHQPPSHDGNTSTPTDRPSSKHGRKGDKIAQGIKEHVSLGSKLSETVKGKLTLGARILQAGGVEKAFRQWFAVDKNEKLLRASQCYLHTTAGPIAGMLFVSTARVAFRSDRSLAVPAPGGATARVPYKVTIPLRKVKAVRPSENKHRPEQRYVHLLTNDGFEFWFMGFVSYHRSLHHLERAVAYAQQPQ
ncbi:hypothetical protein ACP4OV_006190 [Aristida adscensionis]